MHFYDPLPFDNDFKNMCKKIQLFHPYPYVSDNRHKTCINILFKIIINAKIDFPNNIPTIAFIHNCQSIYNFEFKDAQNFAEARFQFYLINTISLLYFVLENLISYIIEDEKYELNKESNIRNKFNILINKISIPDQRHYRDIIEVFVKLRHSLHTLGVYNGDDKKYVFGNIVFEFKKGKGAPLPPEGFIYLLNEIINLIEFIVKSPKFKKYYN